MKISTDLELQDSLRLRWCFHQPTEILQHRSARYCPLRQKKQSQILFSYRTHGTRVTSGQRSLMKGRIARRTVIEDWMVFLLRTLQRKLPVIFNRQPQKLPLPVVVSGPHLIRDFFGPSESALQTASRSVQPFLYRAQEREWRTDRQTDSATPSVAIGRI